MSRKVLTAKFQSLSFEPFEIKCKKTKDKIVSVDSKATGIFLNYKKVQAILINKENKKKELLEKQPFF